jgi:rod shape-determining protein MreD
MSRQREPRGIMVASTLIALVFHVVPLPYWLAVARPAFVVLVVLYWSISAPAAGGIALAFLAGIALDVFKGAVLGQHALALSLVAYLAIRFHLLIRNKGVLEQALFACAALALYEGVVWAIDGWTGRSLASGLRWIHPITGGLLWPFLAALLSRTHDPR